MSFPAPVVAVSCLASLLLAAPRASGLATAPPGGDVLLQVVSPVPGDQFGAAVAAAGDVDGDGWIDVIVGAPRAAPAGEGSGRAEVRSGRDGHLIQAWQGSAPFDAFGRDVAGAGDVDGDGVPDLIIGAEAGEPASGRVCVLSGAHGGLLLELVGEQPGERFGHAVAGVGDADGDGVPDIAVGAPQSDAAGLNAGRACLFSGADGSLLFQWDGAGFDLLGQAVAAAGDVDGDGRADLLVGAPFSDTGAFNAGAAYVVSGADGSLLASYAGTGVGDQLGNQVANAGDVDGDGVPDQALGAPGADVGALDGGAAVLRSGAGGEVLLTVAGLTEGGNLGPVTGVGDLDGDGHADLAVGAPLAGAGGSQSGRVRLVSGATGLDLAVFEGSRPFDWLGASVAGLGPTAGSRRPAVAVGAPGNEDLLNKHGELSVVTVRR